MKHLIRTIVIIAVLALALSLAACSTSSSSTSTVTTTVNGKTTTTTTTTENGVTSTEKTVTYEDEAAADEEASEYDRNAAWHEVFNEGAEGQGEDGSLYYFAVDDFSDMQRAAFLMVSAGEADDIYIVGHFQDSDDGLLLVDDYEEDGHYIRFWVTDTEVEDGFEIEFVDGEHIAFYYVDQDTIIDDMLVYIH